MALDEIFVPYALPDGNWVWRAALDFGEYNLGQYSESLEGGRRRADQRGLLGRGHPARHGSRGTVVRPAARGRPLRARRGFTLGPPGSRTFERDARFARELVVTASMAIGNYTYMVDYVFRLDGSIDVRAGATGTTLNRGIARSTGNERFGAPFRRTSRRQTTSTSSTSESTSTSTALRTGSSRRIPRGVPSTFGNAFPRPRPRSRRSAPRHQPDHDPALGRREHHRPERARRADGLRDRAS